jgi:precorrin-2 dehydrogenase/sirohydrochlorin ferrochelatase
VSATYPILLDVSGRKIVIIGGGAVGLRKTKGLVDAGAHDVTVVSPAFRDGFPPAVRKIQETYRPEHLAGANLVFAATDQPKINAEIVAEAHRAGAWANRADHDEDNSDFTTPAVMRQGPITVAVSAGAPALSAAVRDGLAKQWDARWTELAQAVQTLRPAILASSLPPKQRQVLLRELASEAGMQKLAEGGVEGLRKWVEERISNLRFEI